MTRSGRRPVRLFAALAAVLAGLVLAAPGRAGDAPPVTITGFEYELLNPGHIHMNRCRAAVCRPGSQVSYRFYAPTYRIDFDSYKSLQRQVVGVLQTRLPAGTTIEIEKFNEVKGDRYVLFSTVRHRHMPDGRDYHFVTNLLLTDGETIEVISSSPDKDAAGANSAMFVLGLVAWSAAVKAREYGTDPAR